MFGVVGEEMGVPARDVNLAMLQSTWRVVTPSGAPPRRVRLLQHPEADWFEQALQRFVSDIADRVVLRDPIGQPLMYPWGDLPPFHAHFTDAGPPPSRVAFCETLERVLLFFTTPYREYRDLLQVTFSHEATRLSVRFYVYKDIVQSVRDATEGRRTNFIVSPEILRFSRQVLEKETQEEDPNEYIRTLRQLASQWYQEEDTMDSTFPEEGMTTGDQNLVTQMGWCPMQNVWETSI